MSTRLKKAFSRKPKILKLEFSALKTAMYSSRKLIMIGEKLYLRKDLVEQRMSEVINEKIRKGELMKGKKAIKDEK